MPSSPTPISPPPAPSRLRAWILAARPITLSAACAPVLLAGAWAFHEAERRSDLLLVGNTTLRFFLCLLFAALMQIASNLVNDLIDHLRGSDTPDRLGPPRACSQGWISPHAMRRAVVACLLCALLVGLCLASIVVNTSPSSSIVSLASSEAAPWQLWLALGGIGIACAAACVLYSSHLSRRALGDILVLIFFGAVPVGGSYFALTACSLSEALFVALGGALTIGLATDGLLLINNIRDREQDALSQKRTLVVLVGERTALVLYALSGWGALVLPCCLLPAERWCWLLPYALSHLLALRSLVRIRKGRELNRLLGATSRNILLYALSLLIALLW